MITLNRRRVMGTQQDKYIEDGLIFWLDGINKGGDPTAWTDLASGVIFPWADGVTPLSNRVLFSSNHAMLKGSKYIDWSYQSSHLEIVADSWVGMLVFDQRDGQMALGSNDGGIRLIYGHGRSGSFSKAYRGLSTFSVNNAYAWDNAELQTSKSDTYWGGGGNGITIGGRGSVASFVGDIYCVRAYNRKLSEEEVLHNFEVDKKRFNIV